MKYRPYLIFLVIFLISTQVNAQFLTRTLGARAFQIDDGTKSGKTLTWDVIAPLEKSYLLHWPSTAPTADGSYLAIDVNGNMWWRQNLPLPPLSPGNIWYGNNFGAAAQLPPGPSGSYLMMGNLGMPGWTTALPSLTSVSASQLTSGTIPTGVTITVGNGAIITPANGGIVNANFLSGSGTGKYSGKIVLATGISHLDIADVLIAALSSVTVSVFDPQAMTFGFVEAQVSQITPGVGFRVIFSADYPNSGTGELHYTVINP